MSWIFAERESEKQQTCSCEIDTNCDEDQFSKYPAASEKHDRLLMNMPLWLFLEALHYHWQKLLILYIL